MSVWRSVRPRGSERAHGPKHHEVGRDLSHIANSLCDLGRLDEACQAFRDAQAIDTAALGADHLHTVTDSAGVGVVLATQRKYREQYVEERELRRLVEGRREAHVSAPTGLSHGGTLQTALLFSRGAATTQRCGPSSAPWSRVSRR